MAAGKWSLMSLATTRTQATLFITNRLLMLILGIHAKQGTQKNSRQPANSFSVRFFHGCHPKLHCGKLLYSPLTRKVETPLQAVKLFLLMSLLQKFAQRLSRVVLLAVAPS